MNSDKSELEKEIETLSHADLCEITLSTLRRLLTSDKILNDLPADVTIEEVNSQIAVAQGQSITVQILRNLETPLNVVIPQKSCTVHDLKKAIQRCFELKQQRSRSRSKISWKYLWKTYYLRNNDYIATCLNSEDTSKDLGAVMTDDQALVSQYGVKNKTKISFIKRLRKTERSYRLAKEFSERESREARDRYRETSREREKYRERRRRSRTPEKIETPPEKVIIKEIERSYSRNDPRNRNINQ